MIDRELTEEVLNLPEVTKCINVRNNSLNGNSIL